MDQKGNNISERANQTQNYYYLRKTLQFLVPISIISFLVSYFSSGFLFCLFHDLQFPTLIFPLFAHALDRKCMFLICNGILAFLANNLKLTAPSPNYGGFMKRTDEDDVKQLPQLPETSVVQENAASTESNDIPLDVAFPQEKHTSLQQGQDHSSNQKEAEEKKTEVVIYEYEDEDEDEDEEEEVIEESGSVEDTLVKEEVNDMRVSTEELNKRFEEFIRRMKEEIRIEARQQYMIAV